MVGAAWANAAAYAVQAALAYRFSQRFYPIEYETGRIGLVIAAAVTASLCARALPAMPPIAGLGVRGATVVLVYGAILVAAGFLRPGAVPKFESIRRGPRVEGPAPEVTELGGEIVSAAVLNSPGQAVHPMQELDDSVGIIRQTSRTFGMRNLGCAVNDRLCFGESKVALC